MPSLSSATRGRSLLDPSEGLASPSSSSSSSVAPATSGAAARLDIKLAVMSAWADDMVDQGGVGAPSTEDLAGIPAWACLVLALAGIATLEALRECRDPAVLARLPAESVPGRGRELVIRCIQRAAEADLGRRRQQVLADLEAQRQRQLEALVGAQEAGSSEKAAGHKRRRPVPSTAPALRR